jgi:hypothetical protein
MPTAFERFPHLIRRKKAARENGRGTGVFPELCAAPRIHYRTTSSSSVRSNWTLGELFYKEELEAYKKRGQIMMNLRYLTRQHDSLTDMYVHAKLQFQAVLDQVFPEYRGVFGDLYSMVSLRFLALYPTSSAVLTRSLNDITATIQSLTGRSNFAWALEHALKRFFYPTFDTNIRCLAWIIS